MASDMNHTFGCEHCGSCTERARQKLSQSIAGGWNYTTRLSYLSIGMKSGCSECGVYFDAVNTFFKQECPCFMERDFSIDIRLYYHQGQDKLGCYLWLKLRRSYLHAEQDHWIVSTKSDLSNSAYVDVPHHRQICLELFQVEGTCICRGQQFYLSC
jgi:hypothetical protein